MPRGVYAHLDPHDGDVVARESFSCAAGPAGWRYVSALTDPSGASDLGSVDVTVDARWRPIRVELRSGGWVVRAGVVGDDVVFVRRPDEGTAGGGSDVDEQVSRAATVTGRSPAFAIVTARMLALPPGARMRLRALALTEPVLAPFVIDEGWALADSRTHDTDLGPLVVERYEVADLATGDRRVVHLGGDVVLDATGVELRELETPPTPVTPSG